MIRSISPMLIVLLAVDAMASDPSSTLPEWEPWKIDLQEGYCELQMWHRAVDPPFYPDILFRFIVPVKWRDGRPNSPEYEDGRLYLWLYNYLPNVPKEHRPLHRIESAILDGKLFARRRSDALDANDDMYRFFELSSEEATSVLETFSNVHYLRGTVDLILTLSSGETILKKVRPGHYFRTQARMLSICMQVDFIH